LRVPPCALNDTDDIALAVTEDAPSMIANEALTLTSFGSLVLLPVGIMLDIVIVIYGKEFRCAPPLLFCFV
jgi:hypothetical protein